MKDISKCVFFFGNGKARLWEYVNVKELLEEVDTMVKKYIACKSWSDTGRLGNVD